MNLGQFLCKLKILKPQELWKVGKELWKVGKEQLAVGKN